LKRSLLRVLALLVVVMAALAANVGAAGATGKSSAAAQSPSTGMCIAKHPNYVEGVFETHYTPGCTGHDEPEIDPLSTLPHSAQNMTWKAVLPVDGAFPVSATGPAFWFGGVVTVPGSLFNQGFLELQFYPDSMVNQCASNGGFDVSFARNTYTACSPVWEVVGNREFAAFNAMLKQAGGRGPLVMHGGDTISVHYYETPAHDGAHMTVTDLTTRENGTIILNSHRHGPLNAPFSEQKIGNTLGWGIVHDAPNSFVWEIGHESVYGPNPGAFCIPGNRSGLCQSYNAPAWAGTTPIRILGVTFGGGAVANHYAVVSDFGGKAEIEGITNASKCASYGGPYCIYPWFTKNTDGSFSYGVDYPTTAADYGKAAQFAQVTACGGPFGADSTYCMTHIQ
jgi:hypothetical protein